MRFRKKPVVIDAYVFNPDALKLRYTACSWPGVRCTTYSEVAHMLGTSGCSKTEPFWDWSVMGVIDTLEGQHVVCPGDYVITGVKGEVYPCRADIFLATYEAVEP